MRFQAYESKDMCIGSKMLIFQYEHHSCTHPNRGQWEEEKDIFYEAFEIAYDGCPRINIKIVLYMKIWTWRLRKKIGVNHTKYLKPNVHRYLIFHICFEFPVAEIVSIIETPIQPSKPFIIWEGCGYGGCLFWRTCLNTSELIKHIKLNT